MANNILASYPSQNLIFFDGVCGLCNASLNWFMKRDKKDTFQFAALQGETAKATLPEQYLRELNSFVYLRNGIIYSHSNAALYAIQDLGGIWKPLAVALLIFPNALRDAAYNWVARNRYKWFGKLNYCRVPSPMEASKFLP